MKAWMVTEYDCEGCAEWRAFYDSEEKAVRGRAEHVTSEVAACEERARSRPSNVMIKRWPDADPPTVEQMGEWRRKRCEKGTLIETIEVQ